MNAARNLGLMASGPFRDRGVREALRSIRGTLHTARLEHVEAFDREHGTDTGRTLTLAELTCDGADVPALWRYYPTLRSSFSRVMADVTVRHEEFVFVDLGSGKGRALLMASDYPFQKIVGVELSPSLTEVARRNLGVYRAPTQRCRAFELLCADARDWEPPAQNLVLFLAQPFPRDVFAVVLDRLRESLARAPRELVVAYFNPIFHDQVVASGLVRCERYRRGRAPGEFGYATYSNRAGQRAPA